ncbi:hypothetical protein [Aequorivita sinensis]|uniref:hypothetical protein n=1 Tax=Aequorivita sinensis TaxID=1382458 RepID=UPI0011206384|nr:hypothetical protein [Aequorivita sinensis]
MKTLKYIFAFLLISISVISCSDDDDSTSIEVNPVEGLSKIYEISAANHVVEIYSEKQNLEIGYNEISIRIKDLTTDKYINDAELSWMPMMNMTDRTHSAPHSMLNNAEESTVYKGHIVFQMASNETEYWELKLNYNLNGESVEGVTRITVLQPNDGMVKTQVFMGVDGVKYVLAYVGPQNPEVALNDMQAVLYKMEDMMNFPVVENFKITIDPRMPGMGNHSSPNNRDLTYDSVNNMYNGKLSLTMTGYWKINLKLLNQAGEILKGEDVTEDNPESSLYFELEF